MPTTRIASVEISDSVRSNVGSKHGLSIDDVIAVATSRTTLREWDDSPTHGRRLLITGYTPSGRHIRVVLFPTDTDGAFQLGTAFATRRR